MKKNRIIAVILSLILLVAVAPVSALVAENITPFVAVQVSNELELRNAVHAAPANGVATSTPHVIEITQDIEIIGVASNAGAATADGRAINIAAGRYVHIIGDYEISIHEDNPTATGGMFNILNGAHFTLDGPTLNGNGQRNFGVNFSAQNTTWTTFTMLGGRIANFAERGVRSIATRFMIVDLHEGIIENNGTRYSTGHSGVAIDGRTPLDFDPANDPVDLLQSRIYIRDGVTIRDNGTWGVWGYYHVRIEMFGGEISGNATGVRLGGGRVETDEILAMGLSTFIMHNGLITENHRTRATGSGAAAGTAGGVWVGHNSVFHMHNGEISNNSAPASGGVRVGGDTGGPGRMYMYDGLIEGNIATGREALAPHGDIAANGGGVHVIGSPSNTVIPIPSGFVMYGGIIRNNHAGHPDGRNLFGGGNGGGVHLQNTREIIWPTINFYGGYIYNNTARNDGGGMWVDWTNRMFPDTGTGFRDLTIGENINRPGEAPNLFGNTSRQHFFITAFDRARLASHTTDDSSEWFYERHIPLWNNDQIDYPGIHRLHYGVRGVHGGTLSGTMTSSDWPFDAVPVVDLETVSNAADTTRPTYNSVPISGVEHIIFAATPELDNTVSHWEIGVSRRGTSETQSEMIAFSEEEIAAFIAAGYIIFEADESGVERLIITNAHGLLAHTTHDNYALFVYVHFHSTSIPTPESGELNITKAFEFDGVIGQVVSEGITFEDEMTFTVIVDPEDASQNIYLTFPQDFSWNDANERYELTTPILLPAGTYEIIKVGGTTITDADYIYTQELATESVVVVISETVVAEFINAFETPIPPVESEPPTSSEPPVSDEPPVDSEPPVESEPPINSEPPVSNEPPTSSEPPANSETPSDSEPPNSSEPSSGGDTQPPKGPSDNPEAGDHHGIAPYLFLLGSVGVGFAVISRAKSKRKRV